MKIIKLEYKVVNLTPRVSFKIALTEQATNDTVLLRISTDSGEVGYGEANPFAPVTGESIDTVVAFLETLGPLLQRRSPFELEAIHKVMNQMAKGNSGAKAGVDIALHDPTCAASVR